MLKTSIYLIYPLKTEEIKHTLDEISLKIAEISVENGKSKT